MAEEIVDRLKAEGQLIRNTGTNSIRAVRVKLDKFEGIFETISDQVTLQTRLLADMVEVSMDEMKTREETSEREKARKQREELAADQESKKGEDVTRDDLPNKVSGKEREGIFSLIKGMGLTKLMLGGAAIAGVGFAAYNILKGFIDEKTGGKFSDFEKGMIDTIKNIDFESIKDSFNLMKEKFLSIADNIEKIALFLENPFENLKLADILKTITFGAVATKIVGAKGVPLPLKFGALAVAAAIFGAGGGGAEIPQEEAIDERPEVEKRAREAAINEGPEAAAEIYKEYQEKYPTAIPPGGIIKSPVQPEYWENWLESPEGTEYTNPGMKGRISDLDKQFEADRARTSSGSSQWPPLPIDPNVIGNVPAPGPTSNEIEVLRNKHNEIDKRLIDMENEYGDMASQNSEYQKLLKDFMNIGSQLTFLDAQGTVNIGKYKKGTKGFQDFGPASFAILHGKEAVVPEETPAGRFLNQFFTEDWKPKMSNASNVAERVSTVAAGGISMPVIVNNSPTVAPVINNVQGGPNVTNTNLFGSGGGDRSRNPYGITNAAN